MSEPWTTGGAPRRWLLVANALATGVLLGVLQWSTFFLLQSYLSSAAIVYLLATAVWLLGSLGGLLLPGRAELPWLGAALVAFQVLRVAARAHPYALAWLPLLLVLVAVMGLYAGRFFHCRAGAFPSSRWLFFLENSGFVVGMILTALALYRVGAAFFQVGPVVATLVALATALPLSSRPEGPATG